MVSSRMAEVVPKRFHSHEAGKMTLEQFLDKHRKGTAEIKSEWNNGIIEKTNAMRIDEQYIYKNLLNAFDKTIAYQKGDMLTSELEVWTSLTQWRKPDIVYLNAQQIDNGSDGTNQIPLFIIELISKNDNINVVMNKVKEYFDAGTKIVWLVYTKLQIVQVYTSYNKLQLCSDDDLCSAETVIKGFNLTVNDIFKKKGNPKSD
jgi:Uma2 family endonuclease